MWIVSKVFSNPCAGGIAEDVLPDIVELPFRSNLTVIKPVLPFDTGAGAFIREFPIDAAFVLSDDIREVVAFECHKPVDVIRHKDNALRLCQVLLIDPVCAFDGAFCM